MNAKHTPGPWYDDGGHIIAPDGTNYPPLVADVVRHRPGSADRRPDDDTARANARLIASAPDMLAALLVIETVAKSLNTYRPTVQSAHILSAARAAVALAEGE